MKKIIQTAIIGIGLLVMSGCEANGKYVLSSSSTGTLAIVNASATEKNSRYTIKIDSTTKGIFNLIKGKRNDRYISKGHIKKGKYYSDLFTIDRWKTRDKFHDLKEYRFDYKRHRIVLHYRQWIGGKKVEDTTKKLSFFSHDDYLSVIHNALIANKSRYYRVAGSEESNGKVPVYISHDPKLIQRWGGVAGGIIVQIGIYKGAFNNNKGSLTILLDSKKKPVKFVLSNLEKIKTLVGKPTR